MPKKAKNKKKQDDEWDDEEAEKRIASQMANLTADDECNAVLKTNENVNIKKVYINDNLSYCVTDYISFYASKNRNFIVENVSFLPYHFFKIRM